MNSSSTDCELNGMQLFMLQELGLQRTGPNLGRNHLMLEDSVKSAKEVCHALLVHLNIADALPPDELLLEVPFIFTGDNMRLHPDGITGSFEHVKCEDPTFSNCRDVLFYYILYTKIMYCSYTNPTLTPLK